MKAVLDACVLYPAILRELLIGAARENLFQPVWAPRILEEWRRTAERHGHSVDADITLLKQEFPQALTEPVGVVLGVDLPDPADLHVAEAAVAAGAARIVTANLRDFPQRRLSSIGLRATHPDEFLRDLCRQHPQALRRIVDQALARARAAGSSLDQRTMLRLARLPRFGKAMLRMDAQDAG
ncbi:MULTISPECIES: RSP_2648 family PIN domain-containing protein [unclassified Paracoccus (in: a-proteobacteria)]|uniref:RSP_2648 family PIN domain-containing protein n=1 Tax=unclassified Paracoccus (in: a-proteobacteria) TaxID=2688777 RepID=UPI0012B1B804|nr:MULTISPECIES: PIN domain-containing protein [unclassified Paracoccus (in: a-proteobacteria)]UXU73938.1 PIN domain-containing protein [Paracoccus sp. SMMA_5]UXU79825.1 PIN domain-containing protein [Paracoccus sp. SMMA_5_TC]